MRPPGMVAAGGLASLGAAVVAAAVAPLAPFDAAVAAGADAPSDLAEPAALTVLLGAADFGGAVVSEAALAALATGGDPAADPEAPALAAPFPSSARTVATTSRIWWRRRCRRMCSMIGRPATGTRGFG